jgi:hypothetical protein
MCQSRGVQNRTFRLKSKSKQIYPQGGGVEWFSNLNTTFSNFDLTTAKADLSNLNITV